MLGWVRAALRTVSASRIPFPHPTSHFHIPHPVSAGDADPWLCLQVDWLQQQEVKRRVKRQVRGEPHALPFNDPVWPNMWYLVGISPSAAPRGTRCFTGPVNLFLIKASSIFAQPGPVMKHLNMGKYAWQQDLKIGN